MGNTNQYYSVTKDNVPQANESNTGGIIAYCPQAAIQTDPNSSGADRRDFVVLEFNKKIETVDALGHPEDIITYTATPKIIKSPDTIKTTQIKIGEIYLAANNGTITFYPVKSSSVGIQNNGWTPSNPLDKTQQTFAVMNWNQLQNKLNSIDSTAQNNYNTLNTTKADKVNNPPTGNTNGTKLVNFNNQGVITGGTTLSATAPISLTNGGLALSVIDNVTSVDAITPLSAKQGKALKDLIDSNNTNLANNKLENITDQGNISLGTRTGTTFKMNVAGYTNGYMTSTQVTSLNGAHTGDPTATAAAGSISVTVPKVGGGTNSVTLPAATTSAAGVMTSTQITSLLTRQ